MSAPMRDSKLKVYRYIGKITDAPGSQHEIVIAAQSKRKAFDILNGFPQFGFCSFYAFQHWAHETGNDIQRGVTLNNPGVPFYKDVNDHHAPYVPMILKKQE